MFGHPGIILLDKSKSISCCKSILDFARCKAHIHINIYTTLAICLSVTCMLQARWGAAARPAPNYRKWRRDRIQAPAPARGSAGAMPPPPHRPAPAALIPEPLLMTQPDLDAGMDAFSMDCSFASQLPSQSTSQACQAGRPACLTPSKPDAVRSPELPCCQPRVSPSGMLDEGCLQASQPRGTDAIGSLACANEAADTMLSPRCNNNLFPAAFEELPPADATVAAGISDAGSPPQPVSQAHSSGRAASVSPTNVVKPGAEAHPPNSNLLVATNLHPGPELYPQPQVPKPEGLLRPRPYKRLKTSPPGLAPSRAEVNADERGGIDSHPCQSTEVQREGLVCDAEEELHDVGDADGLPLGFSLGIGPSRDAPQHQHDQGPSNGLPEEPGGSHLIERQAQLGQAQGAGPPGETADCQHAQRPADRLPRAPGGSHADVAVAEHADVPEMSSPAHPDGHSTRRPAQRDSSRIPRGAGSAACIRS